jgi:hypothetical protein
MLDDPACAEARTPSSDGETDLLVAAGRMDVVVIAGQAVLLGQQSGDRSTFAP